MRLISLLRPLALLPLLASVCSGLFACHDYGTNSELLVNTPQGIGYLNGLQNKTLTMYGGTMFGGESSYKCYLLKLDLPNNKYELSFTNSQGSKQTNNGTLSLVQARANYLLVKPTSGAVVNPVMGLSSLNSEQKWYIGYTSATDLVLLTCRHFFFAAGATYVFSTEDLSVVSSSCFREVMHGEYKIGADKFNHGTCV